MNARRHPIGHMVVCAKCGKEFRSRQETSIIGGLTDEIRHTVGIIPRILAALFIIGGVIGLSRLVATALADHDFSLSTQVFSVMLVVIIALMLVLFRNWRQARMYSRFCTDCAFEMLKH